MKKHLNKILVFSLNLLLMAVAILAMKEKDQARLSEKQQNDLLNNNAALSNENSALKSELQSLEGVGEEIKSAVTGEEQKTDIPEADAKATDIPVGANTPKNANASNNSTSNSAASPLPAPAAVTAPLPNSQTKTS